MAKLDDATIVAAPGATHEDVSGDPPLNAYRFTLDDLMREPAPPEFLIPGYLPVDVFALTATGGVGKSTLWMIHAIHLILGRPLWDMPIAKAGPAVYVTAEDDKPRLLWRLYNVIQQLDLSAIDRRIVADNFHVVDLVGSGRRLAELDQRGNIVITSLADQLINKYRAIAPVMMTLDPMVKLGPGERVVNDGEDSLINAAHRIKRELRCATGYIHHVSKYVARNGVVDHHAGRGGSALGDGARAVYNLLTITSELAANYPGAEIYQEDIEQGRLLAYHVTKLTDARKPPEPLILRRNGWLFEPVEMPSRRELESAAEAARRDRLKRNQEKLIVYLRDRPEWKPSRKDLEDVRGEIGLSRDVLRSALTGALRDGQIIERDLPEEEQQGGKKKFFAVSAS